MKKGLKKLIANDGQTLLLVMLFLVVATAGLMYVLNQGKATKNLAIQEAASEEVQNAVNLILSSLSNGAHCNANFYAAAGKPLSSAAPITDIYKCNSGSCTTTPSTSIAFKGYTGVGADKGNWDSNVSGLGNKVRLKEWTYVVLGDSVANAADGIYSQRCLLIANYVPTSPVSCTAGSQRGYPATVKITLKLDKRSGNVSSGDGQAFKTVSKDIFIRVITDHSPGSPGGVAATKIIGCPRNSNTTTIY